MSNHHQQEIGNSTELPKLHESCLRAKPGQVETLRGESSQWLEGHCTLVFGCMGAGKTSRLMGELSTMADAHPRLRVAYVTFPKSNNRESQSHDSIVSSHSSQFTKLSKKVKPFATKNLEELDVSQFDVIGVDEAQFYDKDMVDVVRHWVLTEKKRVIVAGLDGYSNMQPFGHAKELICISAKVLKLSAFCEHCTQNGLMKEAYFTYKKAGDKEQQEEVGGLDLYVPVCLACHQRLTTL